MTVSRRQAAEFLGTAFMVAVGSGLASARKIDGGAVWRLGKTAHVYSLSDYSISNRCRTIMCYSLAAPLWRDDGLFASYIPGSVSDESVY